MLSDCLSMTTLSIALAVLICCHTVVRGETAKEEKITNLHFYFHDIVSGDNVTAINVVKPPPSSASMNGFGMINVMDDPLTEGPEPDSKVLGYAQGIYSGACRRELRFLMAASFVFHDEKYNGSSLSMLGSNAALHDVREMPIVGGTGLFRLARGHALAHTHFIDFKTGNAVVEYNVTVTH